MEKSEKAMKGEEIVLVVRHIPPSPMKYTFTMLCDFLGRGLDKLKIPPFCLCMAG